MNGRERGSKTHTLSKNVLNQILKMQCRISGKASTAGNLHGYCALVCNGEGQRLSHMISLKCG